jgi:deoxyribodipyrimidine photo-lyase
MMFAVTGKLQLAGVGNDPRKNRYFNIEKQANDYDKDRHLRFWLQ